MFCLALVRAALYTRPVMAHWDEERDRRWVKRMRECEHLTPKMKELIDKFEEDGDLIYRDQFLQELRNKYVNGNDNEAAKKNNIHVARRG